ERDVLRARIATDLAEPDRGRALATLDRGPSHYGVLSSLLVDGSGEETTEPGGIRIHRGRCLSVLRALPAGTRTGYVVYEASLLAGAPLPGAYALVRGSGATVAGGSKDADATFGSDLVVHVVDRDAATAAANVTRAGVRVMAATVIGLCASIAL